MMGRRTYEQAADPDGYAESYEFRVPLVIVTSHPPAKTPKEGNGVSFIFATQGVADAARRAKEAAKGRDVQCVGGAMLIRSLLREGLVDELQIDVMPVLFGSGLRLFSDDDAHRLRLTSSEHHASGRVSLVYSIA
jgi:dihydrofolate reductase